MPHTNKAAVQRQPLLRITCARGGEHFIPLNEAPAFILASLEDACDLLCTLPSTAETIGPIGVARSRVQEALEAYAQLSSLSSPQTNT